MINDKAVTIINIRKAFVYLVLKTENTSMLVFNDIFFMKFINFYYLLVSMVVKMKDAFLILKDSKIKYFVDLSIIYRKIFLGPKIMGRKFVW